MAKISNNPLLLLIRKRCYAVAAENAKVVAAPTVARKVAGESPATASSGDSTVGAKGEIFWMRDPKTGNWVPENHFGDVDVVDLRHKFLSNTHNL